MKSLLTDLSTQKLSHHDERALRARRGFPQTDFHYQAKASVPTCSSPVDYAAQMRRFRQLSDTVMGAEARRQFAAEAAVFGLVMAIVAWPLISLFIVLAQTARG